jgi:hypothetical protein
MTTTMMAKQALELAGSLCSMSHLMAEAEAVAVQRCRNYSHTYYLN